VQIPDTIGAKKGAHLKRWTRFSTRPPGSPWPEKPPKRENLWITLWKVRRPCSVFGVFPPLQPD